jgi:cytochrome b561
MKTKIYPQRYDRRTIALHWITAGLVILLWILGQTIDWFPKGSLRAFARSTHVALGVVLGAVLAFRVGWRFSGRGRRLPPLGPGWAAGISHAIHMLLYLMLTATVAFGIANEWVRGDLLFNVMKVPAFTPDDDARRQTVQLWHAFAANTLMAVALVHALSGLMHDWMWKDGVLQRMIPAK